jgi:hypothetical protein
MMLFLGKYDEHWTHTDKPANTIWTFMDKRDGSGQIDWPYSRAHLVPGWNIPVGVYIQTEYAMGSPMFIAKQHTNVHLQFPYVTEDTMLPRGTRWTPAEVARAATMQTDLTEYLRESWAFFTSGQTELNDANWDAFIAECYRLGAGEITAINQAVVDRWNAELGN